MDLDSRLGLWKLHTPMAIQIEKPWQFIAKGLDFQLALGRLYTMASQRLHFYILLPILSPFLWTLNKVWPFNPMAF